MQTQLHWPWPPPRPPLAIAAGRGPVPGAHHPRLERRQRGPPVGSGVKKMQACLTEKSGGKMKLQGFWGGALGGDLQATQALRSGTQEMVVTSTSPLVGILPDLGVFDLPFLFANEKEADAVLDGSFGQYISEKLPDASASSTSPTGRTASAT